MRAICGLLALMSGIRRFYAALGGGAARCGEGWPNDFVSDPAHRGSADRRQDEVARASADQFGDELACTGRTGEAGAGRCRFLCGEEDLDRAGDLRGVAADRRAVVVEHGVLAAEFGR